jgi:hypothetical protein
MAVSSWLSHGWTLAFARVTVIAADEFVVIAGASENG